MIWFCNMVRMIFCRFILGCRIKVLIIYFLMEISILFFNFWEVLIRSRFWWSCLIRWLLYLVVDEMIILCSFLIMVFCLEVLVMMIFWFVVKMYLFIIWVMVLIVLLILKILMVLLIRLFLDRVLRILRLLLKWIMFVWIFWMICFKEWYW